MKKDPLPPISDEIRQAPKPRMSVDLKPREELPDDEITARSHAIGEKWGAATQISRPQVKEPVKPTAPLVSVRFDCPDYLDTSLSVRAAEMNVTKTYLILEALRAGGYRVEDVDIVKDRRRDKRPKT